MLELADYLRERGFLEDNLLYNAFSVIDRKDFVLEEHRERVYDDVPLPIGYGQTISQPQVVAFMFDLLELRKDHEVLDVGIGSGWTTALLAETAKEGRVTGIEKIPEIYEFAVRNLQKYSFLQKGKVEVFLGDGKEGKKEKAPFDRILVSAADTGFELPSKIKGQIKEGGRVVIPIKSSIFVFIKKGDVFEKSEYPGFSFVPLV